MSGFKVKASKASLRTSNPIRAIVDNLKVNPDATKEFISLALGDPTVFGNFTASDETVAAVKKELETYKANGYIPATGTVAARKAIADAYTRPEAPLTANDVIIASGCSGALVLCIEALADEGQNILLPQPGFPLYETIATARGVDCRFYDLDPSRSWEMDLTKMESLIDDKTAFILINNPSNPCGSVYSRQHLQKFLQVAERHKLPVIADEIYADMTFTGSEFVPLATLTSSVPILTTGGLAKKHLTPGWRVGWILIHDQNGAFDEVRIGLSNLTTLILGANSLIQAAIPSILASPKSHFEKTMAQLERNAHVSAELLTGIPGIRPVVPQGAMYLMLEINPAEFKDIVDDIEFAQKLVDEESVLCLPGKCFRCPRPFVRIVFTPPVDKLEIAYARIRDFCARHHV
ncbi:pyridoxal phosphate-dependent transferase [Gaertneriomyces semiglobifer]|nr:pyridoxal phosphate-dependent transferase [Gaertneriomyces semiglobifer]